MNDRITQLIETIKQLEDELSTELHQQQDELIYTLNGKKIEFEQSIEQAHRKLRLGLWRWLFGIRARNIITAPIIYSLIIPLVITDIFVSFYQFSCFPIYKINKVRRSEYIVIDRHQLAYLNIFEKFHCVYCGYANGLIAYITEIVARTELYFCPIKHARKVLASHSLYRNFISFGEAENYHQKLEAFRQSLGDSD